LRLSAGGCAVVELLAEVGFEPVQLSDERGPVDPDRACGGVDAAVGHRDGESLEPGPSAGLSLDSTQQQLWQPCRRCLRRGRAAGTPEAGLVVGGEEFGAAWGRALRLAGGGCAVEELGSGVAFEALELFDECTRADAEGLGCFGERGVGHGDGEAVEPFRACSAGERAVQVVGRGRGFGWRWSACW
jgi:hypothetical protein